MSAGPIARERASHAPKQPSKVGDAARVCAESAGHAYCGRRNKTRANRWDRVTCNDCRAAHNEDEGRQRHELLEVDRG